ncbi:hypothetical protein Tco_1247227, partial [Tanacetum coccineum]
MVGGNDGNQFRQCAGQNVRNQNGYNAIQNVKNQVVQNAAQNSKWECTKPRKRDAAILQTQLLITLKEEAGTQLQAEKFDFMAATDGSAEVHHSKKYYDNDIFNMFTQEEQYTELLKPISEPRQVQQNDGNVISTVSSVEQSGGTAKQHPATIEET